MLLSRRTQWAIEQMRRCQAQQEQFRKAAQSEYEAAKIDLTRAYQNTQRETLGNLDKTIQRRALNDQTRKDLVGDESFYRSLTLMYASVAQVELALDEARERESIRGQNGPESAIQNQPPYNIFNVSTPRAE